MKMNTRQVSYRLIVCAIILYSATVTASQYADYSRRPLSEMLEVYSRFEANLQTGSNYNVGAAAALMAAIGKKGGREVFPFLEEKILAPVTPAFVRSAAAEIYASLATGEECAEFLPKILKVDDEDKTIISWRYRVTPTCLRKIEEAATKGELQEKTLEHLIEAFVTYTQSAYYSTEATWIDGYLSKHCEGYQTSKQRLVLATALLEADKENEKKREVWLPIKESVEAIPPRKRIDLRKRFPDLPPLPDDAPARSPVKVAIAIVAGVVALAVCAVAAWLVLRRKKVHETS
jgi:hypothetical protein